jgi:hypothetical protein
MQAIPEAARVLLHFMIPSFGVLNYRLMRETLRGKAYTELNGVFRQLRAVQPASIEFLLLERGSEGRGNTA